MERLYEAAFEGNVTTLKSLIQQDASILNTISLHDTPLHVAILRGHHEFTRLVLSHTPQLATESDTHGNTPLHVASAKGYVEIVRELLRVGLSSCMVVNKDGLLPLHLAVMKGGRVEVVSELTRACPESTRLRLGRGETIYHLCVKNDNLDALKVLVDESDDINNDLLNARNDDGNTILHLAGLRKNLRILKYLISRPNIELNVVNNRGHTALNLIENSPRDLKGLELLNFLLQSNTQRSNGHQSTITTNLLSTISRQESPMPRPRTKSKSLKKFFTFDSDTTTRIEKMRGGLLVTSIIIIAIIVLPLLYIEIHDDSNPNSKNDLLGDFSLTTIPLWSGLILIVFLLSGFSLRNELCAWFVVQLMYTMLGFLGLYFIGSMVSNEDHYVNVNGPLILMLFIWNSFLMLVSLLNMIRIVVWLVKIIKGFVEGRKMRARGEENHVLLNDCLYR